MFAEATRPWPYNEGPSAAILGALLGLLLLVVVLALTGLLQAGVRGAVWALKGLTRRCFLLWERTLGWMPWQAFAAFVLVLLIVGPTAEVYFPPAIPFIAAVALYAGFISCLAYVHLDFERVEIERGYKVLSNPGPGQELSHDYIRHGHRAPWPLLVAAGVAFVVGFSLLNLAIYRFLVRAYPEAGWYDMQGLPGTFADFAAYSVVALYNVIDLLDLLSRQRVFDLPHVTPAYWPAKALLIGYKSFFMFILVHQVISALRRSGQLNQLVADFWSPNRPIHERARSSLPLFGAAMVPPLLRSLREAPRVTREMRDELPDLIAEAGHSAIPPLRQHLGDGNENVRAVAAAALGRLGGRQTLGYLVRLARDSSDAVRAAAIDAIARILTPRARYLSGARPTSILGWLWLLFAPRQRAVNNGMAALCDACRDRAPLVRVRALVALGELGEAAFSALPIVREALSDEDDSAEQAAVEALVRIGGANVLPDLLSLCDAQRPHMRLLAARALGQLGKSALPGACTLAKLVLDRDEAVSMEAAHALARAGELSAEAVPLLEAGLTQEDNILRKRVARAIGEMGPVARPLAPALTRALDDENDGVRAEATEALGKLGEAVPEAIARLTAALQDEDNWVTALAAEALGKLGGADHTSTSALASALTHPTPEVRANAARSLGQLGGAAAPAIPALIRAAADRDPGVRQAAVRALGQTRRIVRGVQHALEAALKDELPSVRAAAVASLRGLGLLLEKQCVALLEDGSDEVELEALKGLQHLNALTPEGLAGACRCLLNDPNTEVRVKAAEVLGASEATETVCVSLHEAARTAEAAVRVEALRALASLNCSIGPDAFTEGLKDTSPQVRRAAILGWAKVNENHPQAAPSLIAGLEDPDVVVRATAAFLLGRRKELPPDAVAPLLTRLQDEDGRVRFHSVVALRRQSSPEVQEALLRRLEDESLRVRLAAARAIMRHDRENEAARKAAEEALQSADETERRLAQQVLG
jgi:HEAT repeat protein